MADSGEAQRISGVLEAVWRRNQPLFRTRLEALENGAQLAAAGTLTPDKREELAEIAHKFAGSLGMFGFPRGSELGKELEPALREGTLTPERFAEITTELRTLLFGDEA